MSELTVTILKLAFLAVLWLFILSAVSVMRADLFGTRVGRTGQVGQAGAVGPAEPKPAKPVRAGKPAKPRRGAPSQAVVIAGHSSGTAIRLGDRNVVLGRGADCDLRIDDEYISTRHAVLRLHDGVWYAEDLGSTNGTFVEGARIHGPTEIRVGSRVRLGKTTVELRK
jgi:hypothetical protein